MLPLGMAVGRTAYIKFKNLQSMLYVVYRYRNMLKSKTVGGDMSSFEKFL